MSNHIEVVRGMVAELEAKTTTAFIVTEHPVVTQWRAELAALRALLADVERFNSLTDIDGLSVNQWIMQVRGCDGSAFCYHAQPPSGNAIGLAATKLDALRAAVDAYNAYDNPSALRDKGEKV
jgi:hypothetical protein